MTRKATYSYPSDLASRIRGEWSSSDSHSDLLPELPSDGHLNEFLETAYQASMLTEEQRRIGFRLAYIDPRTANMLAGPVELGRLHEPVIFRTPRKFTVGEILRLAPATDHTKVLICVSPIPDSEDGGDSALKIWGILDTGSSWWDYTSGESRAGTPPPDCLTLSSIEPGNLTLSRGGVVLFSLKRGLMITPRRRTLYQGPLAKFFQRGEMLLFKEVFSEIGGIGSDLIDNLKDTPKHYYFRFLERLLFQIREEQHGGGIIVLEDSGEEVFEQLEGSVMIKYPCDYDCVWSLLIRVLVLRLKYAHMYRDCYRKGASISIIEHRELDRLQQQQREIEDRISDTIKMIASAASVDGAVLLTDRHRLLGFGGEIVVNAPDLREVYAAKDHLAEKTVRVPIESYGTRHRSAFRFCWEHPDCVAFVVSMDGGVKGVRRIGDKMIFWPDINFGPLGI